MDSIRKSLLIGVALIALSYAQSCENQQSAGWICGGIGSKVKLCSSGSTVFEAVCGSGGCLNGQCSGNFGFCVGKLRGWYRATWTDDNDKQNELLLDCNPPAKNPVDFVLCLEGFNSGRCANITVQNSTPEESSTLSTGAIVGIVIGAVVVVVALAIGFGFLMSYCGIDCSND
jgi:hypothetical protein